MTFLTNTDPVRSSSNTLAGNVLTDALTNFKNESNEHFLSGINYYNAGVVRKFLSICVLNMLRSARPANTLTVETYIVRIKHDIVYVYRSLKQT